MDKIPLLEIKNLSKSFILEKNFFSPNVEFKAVNNVNLKVYKGETLGLVGESGCGKSTLGKTILKLIEPSSGEIFYNGTNITNLSSNSMRPFRRKMQIIFQDPYASLNPRMSVRTILEEPLIINKIGGTRVDREKRLFQLLDYVKMPKETLDKYPHQFSGGQRQRICIARALAVEPDLIICDESVSALDVSIQAQVINLLMDLQKELNISYIFISHDLKLVKFISHQIAVMYFGKVVEEGPSSLVFSQPRHPYTKALLSAIPLLGEEKIYSRIIIDGDLPSPSSPPKGCFFASRCWKSTDKCFEKYPHMALEEERKYACYHPVE